MLEVYRPRMRVLGASGSVDADQWLKVLEVLRPQMRVPGASGSVDADH